MKVMLFCMVFSLQEAVTNDGSGPVAQLGERCVRIAEVEGSNPFGSTMPEQSPLCSGLFFIYDNGYAT